MLHALVHRSSVRLRWRERDYCLKLQLPFVLQTIDERPLGVRRIINLPRDPLASCVTAVPVQRQLDFWRVTWGFWTLVWLFARFETPRRSMLSVRRLTPEPGVKSSAINGPPRQSAMSHYPFSVPATKNPAIFPELAEPDSAIDHDPLCSWADGPTVRWSILQSSRCSSVVPIQVAPEGQDISEVGVLRCPRVNAPL